MSAKTCGGKVVAKWEGKGCSYFLRDDCDAGLCDEERYSLFRETPDYGRIAIYTEPRSMAIADAGIEVILDQQSQKRCQECVACGARYYGTHHKCDPKLESRIEGGYKSHDDAATPEPSYHRRLKDGFRMLSGESF